MKTILYADDNQDIVELVKLVLGESGYRLVTVNNGAEVLKYCRKQLPDLILMDLNMPMIGGIETTRYLRERDIQIPVVVLTASESDLDYNKALSAGCNGYMLKTLQMSGLESLIDMHMLEAA